MAEERALQEQAPESRASKIIRIIMIVVFGGGVLLAVAMAAYRKFAG